MIKRLLGLLLLVQLVSAVEISITPEFLDFTVPVGGVGQQKIYVQNNEGIALNAEFSSSRQLVPFLHIASESSSIFSVYVIVPPDTPEQALEGVVFVQLTSQKDSITTADLRTIEKKIPVKLKVSGKTDAPAAFSMQSVEEPIVPLSFNTLPLVMLIIVLLFVVNTMLRSKT